ncbi:MAG TPA: choice-of-anchor V domain-containing protein [Candidatus Acidoferrales bacterium]|jgi:uncharacterized protein (TIGR03437 family)|nr:choice-of-anchor V domain-containing protein [Candidatus Acidoferrales bacterium]
MLRTRKLIFAKSAVVMGAIPFIIWAYEFGPDAGYCGVPGEGASCATIGCHTGTANDPSNKGSVGVNFPNGQVYTPGVKQHLTVTISDPATSQKAWGFQLTARPSSAAKTQAGSFQSTDQFTLLMCASANLFNQQVINFVSGGTQTCPAPGPPPLYPLQYIEHSQAGYNATNGQANSATYQFDWTPPSSDVGNIIFYVAGNAGPPGPVPTQNGAHIYTKTYTLTAAAATGNIPTIPAGGVVSAGAFGGFTSVAPGSWMEIFGSNLSATTRGWAGSDFTGTKAPVSLDNVKVTIGGQAAFIDFISPEQVNAQVPTGTPTGSQQMTVTNSNGTSSAYNITVNAVEPGLLGPSNFRVNGKQYAVAQFSDGSFVMPPGSLAGFTTRQAKPGETIVIYGVGFGPVLDSGNLDIPAGTIVTGLNKLSTACTMSIGGSAATLSYQGLAAGFVGLYQFNVIVPNIANNDLAPLTFALNGVAGSQTLFLAVHN